jgi:hypothetical protein
MGMSMNIVGFSPPDAKWKKMREVHDACGAAGVPVPKEVEAFFGGEVPDESGVKVNLVSAGCVRPFRADMQEGFEVDLGKVQAMYPDMKSIRFYNSY